ncbi:MAG: CBS domain-containing protein [Nitrospiraceae bacterium]|nr:MAG: CBS domain-containing protein [Nitrospiraceae bacterium]
MDKDKIKQSFITSDSSIKQAINKLNETGHRILFVTDPDEKLTGTVTDGDIRRGIVNGIQLTDPVSGIMNSKFFSLKADSPDKTREAERIMQKHLISHIPVLDRHGRVTDVISWIDCLNLELAPHRQANETFENAVVIMAGGKGTRLDPFTKILPKPLVPLRDKPIIEHIMDRFFMNGFSRFILIVNYKKEMIKSYFSDTRLPYSIEFVDETEFSGTAGGLSLLRDRIDSTFIVTNCDTILEGEFSDFFNWHREHNNLLTIIGSHKEIEVPYGVLNMNNGLLLQIDEKPRIDLFINTGTYIFEPALLGYIADGERVDMDKFIEKVKASDNERVGVYPHWGGWLDLGQWDEYRKSLKKIGESTDEL